MEERRRKGRKSVTESVGRSRRFSARAVSSRAAAATAVVAAHGAVAGACACVCVTVCACGSPPLCADADAEARAVTKLPASPRCLFPYDDSVNPNKQQTTFSLKCPTR